MGLILLKGFIPTRIARRKPPLVFCTVSHAPHIEPLPNRGRLA